MQQHSGIPLARPQPYTHPAEVRGLWMRCDTKAPVATTELQLPAAGTLLFPSTTAGAKR